jgi:hypothetical protein
MSTSCQVDPTEHQQVLVKSHVGHENKPAPYEVVLVILGAIRVWIQRPALGSGGTPEGCWMECQHWQ